MSRGSWISGRFKARPYFNITLCLRPHIKLIVGNSFTSNCETVLSTHVTVTIGEMQYPHAGSLHSAALGGAMHIIVLQMALPGFV